MTVEHMWYVTLGSLIGSGIFFVATISQRFRAKKPKPTKPTELDDLVHQERSKQGVPLLAWVAVNAPVDVKTLTLILRYEDDKRLVMECGRPERMEVEP